MIREEIFFFRMLLIILLSSCSSINKHSENAVTNIDSCSGNECEVERYEILLKAIGVAESDLKEGNSFKALRDLEAVREQAYYHGRFKSLYQLAQESCFKSTNDLSGEENSCSLVRERVNFIKAVSPDKLNNLSVAISNCSIDISKNSQNFELKNVSKHIELTNDEIKASNVYETALKIQQKYNSNPWEELLIVDLKTLSNYELILGKPAIQKETPSGFVRFKVPLIVKVRGKTSYCSQYKEVIHDEDLSDSISCYDYPDFSDQMAGIFSLSSAKPQKWTEGSHLTPIKVSSASKQYVRELPFIKNYRNGLQLDIYYGSGKVLTVLPLLSYPGELIHNLMGRLAWIANGGESVRPHTPEIYIEGHASSGVYFKIIKRKQSLTDFWGGYDMDIIIPIELARDLESLKLSIPVQKIWDQYHDLATREEPISGGVYGE